MSYSFLSFYSADSWMGSPQTLIAAYRDYSLKGKVCSKGACVQSALQHAVKAVGLACLVPLAFLTHVVTFGHGILGDSYVWMKMNFTMMRASAGASKRFESTMKKMRVLEAKAFCRTIITDNSLFAFQNPVLHDSKAKRISFLRPDGYLDSVGRKEYLTKEAIVRLKALNEEELNEALTFDVTAHAGNYKTCLNLLLRLQNVEQLSRVSTQKIEKIEKLFYEKLQMLVVKKDNGFLLLDVKNVKQPLLASCPELATQIDALEKRRGVGLLNFTAEQERVLAQHTKKHSTWIAELNQM